ncbi:MAG: DnaJ C-terminal domain-containing protein [Myxococcota bacterium]
MSEQRDLYTVLGVARDADFDTIRKEYRKLARQTHPDLNPGDEKAAERFSEISRAWEVLQDTEKRQLYDEFGAVSLEAGFDAEQARTARDAFGRRFGGAAPGTDFGSEFQFGDLDDLLGRFFGGRQAGEAGFRMPGSDLEAHLTLDFEQAMRGGETPLTLQGPDGTETVKVRIPPGVDSGGRLRIPGKGGPGVGGGTRGDLWVTLTVRPHRLFRREGRDLAFDLPVSVREAIRGAEIEVPTLDGRVQLRVPPGTHSGTRLRLRGKGVPDPKGGTSGDLYAHVQIRVPEAIDEAAALALDALEDLEDPGLRKELFS